MSVYKLPPPSIDLIYVCNPSHNMLKKEYTFTSIMIMSPALSMHTPRVSPGRPVFMLHSFHLLSENGAIQSCSLL